MTTDILIIGGGIVGCAIAHKLSAAGAKVALLETRAKVGEEATQASGGILCYEPSSDKPDEWHLLGNQAIAAHKNLERQLKKELERPPEWSWCGILKVGLTKHEKPEFYNRFVVNQRNERHFKWLTPKKVERAEPRIASTQGGYLNTESGWIDALQLTRGLQLAAEQHGAVFHFNTTCRNLMVKNNKVVGALTDVGEFYADKVVMAAGAWSSEIQPSLDFEVTPARGQAIGIELDECPINQVVYGNGIYLIPRTYGMMIGATMEEVGFRRETTIGCIHELLTSAMRLMPDLAYVHWEQVSAWNGFRPKPSTLHPIVGKDSTIKGLWWATGHFRNGILLAPITAEVVAREMLRME